MFFSKADLLLLLFGFGLSPICIAAAPVIEDAILVERVAQEVVSEVVAAADVVGVVQPPNPSCSWLVSRLGSSKVQFPGSFSFTQSLQSFFSLQEQDLVPSCIVFPSSARDVADIVKVMKDTKGKFAIRSGGHTMNAGAANIQDGVTIDLKDLNTITVSSDRNSVQIGTGARWIDVFRKLDPLGLMVTGGRAASIGVGGFLTGGGISPLAGSAGWGCDTVTSFEVVLACGNIVTASANSYSDLFLALKGGSNNLGVVTMFTLKTHRISTFWGGFIRYTAAETSKQLAAFSNYMEPRNFDPNANIVQSFGFRGPTNPRFISLGMYYTKPQPFPPVFRQFIDNTTSTSSSLRIDTASNFATEQDRFQAPDLRQIYYTVTFAHTPSIYQRLSQIFDASIPAVTNVPGINWFLILQSTPIIKNGANNLGLNSGDQRLVIALLTVFYPRASDDAVITAASQALIDAITAATKAAGVYRPYLYLNYAAGSQKVIDGYGATAKSKLQAACRKYDPDRVFQTQVPGGFKAF